MAISLVFHASKTLLIILAEKLENNALNYTGEDHVIRINKGNGIKDAIRPFIRVVRMVRVMRMVFERTLEQNSMSTEFEPSFIAF